MTLRDIELKPSYDSDEDDILTSFYIPALSQSVKYYRLAGFFSSSTLAIAARGIASLVTNNGHMKLVVGVVLRKEDIEAIRHGIETPEKVISSMFISELSTIDDIEDAFIRDHVLALAWMIANKKLEIKIAILTDEKGFPLSKEEIEKRGIFHLKVGVLEDKEGNLLSFSGSVNESATGWIENIEEFKIFRSWVEGEIEYLQSDLKKFNKYWYGQAIHVKILDVPKAVKENLIKIAPKKFDELKFVKAKPKKEIKLNPVQIESVQSWLNNNKKGIFEIATGVGKTYAALECIKRIEKEIENFGVVIVCPFQHLIKDPWEKSIENFNFLNVTILTAYGSTQSWIKSLSNEILNLNSGISKKIFIITTYDTFSSEQFIKKISQIEKPLLFIADEVHNVGSPERKKGLLGKYTYRLGLSATPSRWFDPEGSEIIYDFFDKSVYKFTIKQAINTINPNTGETYLTPYEYCPHFVELTPEEFFEYEKISKKINIKYHQTKDNKEKRSFYELLLFERSRLLKNAKNKIREFEKVLNTLINSVGDPENIRHYLVYCAQSKAKEENQMNLVKTILDKKGIINHRFTQNESYKEREELLKNFDAGKYQVLIAIKCLDEGVDVPSTKTAIILASTKNPREAIQRRGRILRRFPSKEKAILHDFIIVPTLKEDLPKETFELERKILQGEFERVREFADASNNKLQVLNILIPMLRKYHISLKVI